MYHVRPSEPIRTAAAHHDLSIIHLLVLHATLGVIRSHFSILLAP